MSALRYSRRRRSMHVGISARAASFVAFSARFAFVAFSAVLPILLARRSCWPCCENKTICRCSARCSRLRSDLEPKEAFRCALAGSGSTRLRRAAPPRLCGSLDQSRSPKRTKPTLAVVACLGPALVFQDLPCLAISRSAAREHGVIQCQACCSSFLQRLSRIRSHF